MEKSISVGPVFAGPDQMKTETDIHEGMALRDYFAAKAMQAIIGVVTEKDGGITASAIGCATDGAYFIADEMLRAREA